MKKFLISSIVVLICACSGGGGGGGGSSSGSSGSNASYGVRLLNASLDLAPLGMVSSLAAGKVFSSAAFGKPTFYQAVPEGSQALSVVKSISAGDVIAQASVEVSKGTKQDLLIFGDRGELGIRSSVLSSERPELGSGEAAVRFVHALNGALGVNVAYGGDGEVAVDYGSSSEYLIVPAGALGFSVSRAADSRLVISSSHTLSAGKYYTVLICGEAEYFEIAPLYLD